MTGGFFHNRASEIAANILAAQCQDLGLAHIERHPDGRCSAMIEGVSYTFSWDVDHQSAVLDSRFPPEDQLVAFAA